MILPLGAVHKEEVQLHSHAAGKPAGVGSQQIRHQRQRGCCKQHALEFQLNHPAASTQAGSAARSLHLGAGPKEEVQLHSHAAGPVCAEAPGLPVLQLLLQLAPPRYRVCSRHT